MSNTGQICVQRGPTARTWRGWTSQRTNGLAAFIARKCRSATAERGKAGHVLPRVHANVIFALISPRDVSLARKCRTYVGLHRSLCVRVNCRRTSPAIAADPAERRRSARRQPAELVDARTCFRSQR